MKVIGLGIAAGGALLATGAQAAPDCARMARYALPDSKLEITAAARVAAAPPGTVRTSQFGPPLGIGLPGYCKVSGIINRRTGAGGKTYGLRFELALPDDWRGRFLFQGGGGLNGSVGAPLGATAAGAVPALARGFAIVSTDSGHQGAVFDPSFQADQQAALDFAHGSLGTVTAIAKKIVAAYYGKPIAHSYMAGCSTGGREAMLAAERYPDLFDGIVAGAPAMRTGNSNIATSYMAVQFNQAASRDAQGLPLTAQAFSASDRTLIMKGLLDACDGLDGLKDGVIENAASCRFQPARLQCPGDKAEGCLSPAQVKALDAAFSAPRDRAGNVIYAAFPYDTGIDATQGIPGVLSGAPGPLGPPNRSLSYDIDAALATARADAVQMLTDTSGWTNLSTFLDRGGKILFYNGMSDPWFSAWDTLDYWRRAEQANGAARWAGASRFYVVPGMGHCGGGANTFDQFDLLGAVVDWVEKGQAPAAVVSTRAQPKPASRPMCPFPAYPHYKGGDEALAASFQCRTPEGS